MTSVQDFVQMSWGRAEQLTLGLQPGVKRHAGRGWDRAQGLSKHGDWTSCSVWEVLGLRHL